jgi:hypothetical protein
LVAEYALAGAAGWLLAAMPAGFSGDPTAAGVAPSVDWKGLLRQNAQLLPFEQPDRATRVERASAQHVVWVRMVSVLRSQEKIEQSSV